MEIDTPSNPIGNIITSLSTVEYFDSRYYKFTFTGREKPLWIASVTHKLEEYREQGIESFRERVGSEEADERLEEGGRQGGIVHHGCFLIATGGAVLYEPPAYQTIGVPNEEVDELHKRNASYREQLDKMGKPHLTINDQFRFLQVMKFRYWFETVKPKVLFAETRVYSPADGIAGRIDFLMEVQEGKYPISGSLRVDENGNYSISRAKDIYLPGGIILPDVKSGGWSNKYWLQMGAYRKAVEVSLGKQVMATVGIRLKSSSANPFGLITDVHGIPEMDEDLQNFYHVAAIFDMKHKNEEPLDFRYNSIVWCPSAVTPDTPLGAILPNPEAEKKINEEELAKAEGAQGSMADSSPAEPTAPEAKEEPNTTSAGEGVDATHLQRYGRRRGKKQ